MKLALSLRSRLTVWYTVALLIVLALGGAVVLWQQGRIGLARVDRQLRDLTTTVANLVQEELSEDPVLARAAHEVEKTISARGRDSRSERSCSGRRLERIDCAGAVASVRSRSAGVDR